MESEHITPMQVDGDSSWDSSVRRLDFLTDNSAKSRNSSRFTLIPAPEHGGPRQPSSQEDTLFSCVDNTRDHWNSLRTEHSAHQSRTPEILSPGVAAENSFALVPVPSLPNACRQQKSATLTPMDNRHNAFSGVLCDRNSHSETFNEDLSLVAQVFTEHVVENNLNTANVTKRFSGLRLGTGVSPSGTSKHRPNRLIFAHRRHIVVNFGKNPYRAATHESAESELQGSDEEKFQSISKLPPDRSPRSGTFRGITQNHDHTGTLEGTAAQRFFRLSFILASILQLAFNTTIAVTMLYVMLSLVLSIRSDVLRKLSYEVENLRLEAAKCLNDHTINRCEEVAAISPFMREQCASWRTCMNRDATSSALVTRLLAETLAEVVNSFVEPISSKSLLVLFGFGFSIILLSNIAFGFVKTKLDPILMERDT